MKTGKFIHGHKIYYHVQHSLDVVMTKLISGATPLKLLYLLIWDADFERLKQTVSKSVTAGNMLLVPSVAAVGNKERCLPNRGDYWFRTHHQENYFFKKRNGLFLSASYSSWTLWELELRDSTSGWQTSRSLRSLLGTSSKKRLCVAPLPKLC